MSYAPEPSFDVAIIGGGPAGLSAALLLGRARRLVVVFDHGHPRNKAAQAVHGYLGHDGIPPAALRAIGRTEVQRYGALFVDSEVMQVTCNSDKKRGSFRVETREEQFFSRFVLFATGVVDVLPEIPGLREFYGRSIHHCPYCDGWEHRDARLVALGRPQAAIHAAAGLQGWSDKVAVCTNGECVVEEDRQFLSLNGIELRTERFKRLIGKQGVLERIEFHHAAPLPCDAIFFNSDQRQRSLLPAKLGCKVDDQGLVVTNDKQSTTMDGVYLAGDADGDSQFAIVAAAEGATAAVAIDRALREQMGYIASHTQGLATL